MWGFWSVHGVLGSVPTHPYLHIDLHISRSITPLYDLQGPTTLYQFALLSGYNNSATAHREPQSASVFCDNYYEVGITLCVEAFTHILLAVEHATITALSSHHLALQSSLTYSFFYLVPLSAEVPSHWIVVVRAEYTCCSNCWGPWLLALWEITKYSSTIIDFFCSCYICHCGIIW